MKKMVVILYIIILLCSLVIIVLPAAADTEGKIAFTDKRTGNNEIWVMNPDGSGQTQLTFTSHYAYFTVNEYPTWSPDGSKIIFDSNRQSDANKLGNSEIWVMNSDGSGQTQLTNMRKDDADNKYPVWSPDGSKIVFWSNRLSDSHKGHYWEIYVMNANGKGESTLIVNYTYFPEGIFSWSPDGSKIAFYSDFSPGKNQDRDYEIYVVNADGTGQPIRLTNNIVNDRSPAWSPDGSKIAFESDRIGMYKIWVMNADGTGEKSLTAGSKYYDTVPSWSPDGSSITFVSNRRGNNEIYVMNADGSGQTRLTYNSSYDNFPKWGRLAKNSLKTDVRCGSGGTSQFPVMLDPIECDANQVTVRWKEYNPPINTLGTLMYYEVWKAKDSRSGPIAPFTYYEPAVQKGVRFKIIPGPVGTADIIVIPIVRVPILGDQKNQLIPACYNYVKVTRPACRVPTNL